MTLSILAQEAYWDSEEHNQYNFLSWNHDSDILLTLDTCLLITSPLWKK